jgi:hypothetical protein
MGITCDVTADPHGPIIAIVVGSATNSLAFAAARSSSWASSRTTSASADP